MARIPIDKDVIRSIVAVDCSESRLPPDYQQAAERFICEQIRTRSSFDVEQSDLDRLQLQGLGGDDAKCQAVVEALAAEWTANGGWPLVAKAMW